MADDTKPLQLFVVEKGLHPQVVIHPQGLELLGQREVCEDHIMDLNHNKLVFNQNEDRFVMTVRATHLHHKRGQHVVDPMVYWPQVGQLRSKGKSVKRDEGIVHSLKWGIHKWSHSEERKRGDNLRYQD